MASQPGDTALITGASSGIGAELARVLAERGMSLVLTARRVERLSALKDELCAAHPGIAVDVIAHDLGAHGGAEALYDKVKELGREITVLVNNAGFGVYGNSWEQEPERVRMMMELNMVALTTLTQSYTAEMARRGRGRVLQVASVAAYQPSPLYAIYAATKTYVLYYSEAMNWELRGTGVTITTLCPGLTSTEFHEVANHIKPKSMDPMMMSAREVAEIGVGAMEKGQAVVTPGVMNKLSAVLAKAIPRSLATTLAGSFMKAKR